MKNEYNKYIIRLWNYTDSEELCTSDRRPVIIRKRNIFSVLCRYTEQWIVPDGFKLIERKDSDHVYYGSFLVV